MAAHLIRRADTFTSADAEQGRGRRSAPVPPENPTSLQIFKEHLLTDFYRLEPSHQRFVRSEMIKPDQTGPNFKFSTGWPPKTFTKPLPFLYRFFTQIQFRSQRFGKTGRFPVVFSVLRTAPTDGATRHHPLNIELVLNQNRSRNTTASLAARMI
jgi:hypothetical protein